MPGKLGSLSRAASFSSASSVARLTRSNSAPPTLRSPTRVPPFSADELQAAKNALKRVDYGLAHPELPGIRTRRRPGESVDEFIDFTKDVRASTYKLMSQPTSRQTLRQLDQATHRLTPGQQGTAYHPRTAVDIFSGRGKTELNMAHAPRAAAGAYRYNGKPGTGQASNITYDETAPRNDRFIALGHESVHAWRAANGLQIGELSSFAVVGNGKDPAKAEWAKKVINHHAHLQEEFETIGLRPTPHAPSGWAPSENLMRKEFGLPAREDYSGVTTEATDALLKQADELTADRPMRRMLGLVKEPTPVGKLVNFLEG
jgi:hypothetical protein